jgi:hypothetical protein
MQQILKRGTIALIPAGIITVIVLSIPIKWLSSEASNISPALQAALVVTAVTLRFAIPLFGKNDRGGLGLAIIFMMVGVVLMRML